MLLLIVLAPDPLHAEETAHPGAPSDRGGIAALPYRTVLPAMRGVSSDPSSAVLTVAHGAIEQGIRASDAEPIGVDGLSVRLARVAYSPDAEKDRETARKKLEAAYDAYFSLELPDAMRLIDEASGALERTPQTPADLELLSDLRLLEGTIAIYADPDAARRSFDSVVRLTPGRELDPRKFPPHVVEALGNAETRLRQTPIAQLNVVTTPADVWLSMDGSLRGRTPFSADRLAAGEHFFRLERAGLQPKYGRLNLEGGAVEELEQFLPAVTAEALQEPLLEVLARDRSASTGGAALSKLLAADRVVVASLRADGPRRYQVEMWWADPTGAASVPIRESISAEPSDLAAGIARLTRSVLASGPGANSFLASGPNADRKVVVRVDAVELARDVAMVAAGRADRFLEPPPPPWYRWKSVHLGALAAILATGLGVIAYMGNEPGRVDFIVTPPPPSESSEPPAAR